MVLDGQGVFEVDMLFLFYQTIGVDKTFKVHHQDVWQLLKEMTLVCFDSAAVLLVAFYIHFMEIAI